jgi:branched-subunit amino acid aminotransferase/4-amino-4-deoxychorismate lyase
MRARGLARHLARLDEGSRELFGVGLGGQRVRDLARHALAGDVRDASLRVVVFESGVRAEPSVMVTLRAPGGMLEAPQALHAGEYQRTLAHVKHIGGFGHGHHARMARRAGFDDALFTGHDGAVSETSIANIGFLLGDELVWPSAPALRGITMQLLEPRLATAGIPTRRGPRTRGRSAVVRGGVRDQRTRYRAGGADRRRAAPRKSRRHDRPPTPVRRGAVGRVLTARRRRNKRPM